MSADTELDAWRSQWQSAAEGSSGAQTANEVAQLHRRTRQQTRRQIIGLIAPLLVTVVVGGGMLLRAFESAQPVDIALAVECWLLIAVAWAGSLWIARGTWRPLGETTADFLQLSIRRCEANIRGVTFGALLYFGQLIAVFVVLGRFSTPAEVMQRFFGDYRAVAATALIGVGLAAFGWWCFAVQRTRLASLRQLERELREADAE